MLGWAFSTLKLTFHTTGMVSNTNNNTENKQPYKWMPMENSEKMILKLNRYNVHRCPCGICCASKLSLSVKTVHRNLWTKTIQDAFRNGLCRKVVFAQRYIWVSHMRKSFQWEWSLFRGWSLLSASLFIGSTVQMANSWSSTTYSKLLNFLI